MYTTHIHTQTRDTYIHTQHLHSSTHTIHIHDMYTHVHTLHIHDTYIHVHTTHTQTHTAYLLYELKENYFKNKILQAFIEIGFRYCV